MITPTIERLEENGAIVEAVLEILQNDELYDHWDRLIDELSKYISSSDVALDLLTITVKASLCYYLKLESDNLDDKLLIQRFIEVSW